MLWIPLVLLEVCMGVLLSFCLLPSELNIFVMISFGIPTGIGVSTLIFFITSLFFGQNTFHLLVHIAILGFITFVLLIAALTLKLKIRKTMKFNYYDLGALAAYIVIPLYIANRAYFHSSRFLPPNMEPFIQEDLSLQASFLYGVNSPKLNVFKMKHPNFAGLSVVTRWLTALHSTMIRIGKGSMRMGLLLPTSLEMFAYLIAMYNFAKDFKMPEYIAVLAPFIALNVGGFGFFGFLINSSRTNRFNDYVTDMFMGHPSRFHPLLSIYLASPPNIFAISLLAPIFVIIFKIANKSIKLDKKASLFIGFIPGLLLPPSQHQAFFGFAAYFAIFVVFYSFSGRAHFNFILLVIGFGAGTAFHITRMLTPTFLSNLFGIESPWSQLYKRGVLFPAVDFWMGMYGTFQIVLLVGFFLLNKSERIVFLPSVICFFIFTFLKLVPFCEYTQVTVFCVFMIIAGVVYAAIWYRFVFLPKSGEKRGVVAMIAIIFTVVTCLASFAGTHKQFNSGSPSWYDVDETLATFIMRRTPRDAVFIAPRTDIQVVSVIGGRQVFLSSIRSTRHIGVDKEKREKMLKEFAANNCEGLEKHASYIIRSNSALNDIPADAIPKNWEEVFSNREYTVYHYTQPDY